jgi:heme exporter protein D
MSLGPHAAFIIAAYLAAVAILAAMILWVVLDRRHLRRALAEIEERGARPRGTPQRMS